jgi:hypothetical protein
MSLKALESAKPYLLGIPGVAGFGLSTYSRGELGVKGSEPVVVVYLEREDPWVMRHIPSEIEGFKVKTVVSGRFRTLQLATLQYQHRAKTRPVPGGVSCASLDVGAGTLACRVYDRATGMILGLANNHTLAQNWGLKRAAYVGKPIIQPSTLDGGRYPDDRIGGLERWVDVNIGVENLVDAAVFRPVDGLADEVLGLVDKPLPAVDASVGDVVRKSGRTTGVTEGVVESVNATVSVEGWGEAIFTDQIITSTAIAEAGDSGSYCLNVSRSGTAGLVFAGSELKTAVCKASNVERLLGVSFTEVTPTQAPSWLFWGLVGLGLYLAAREYRVI